MTEQNTNKDNEYIDLIDIIAALWKARLSMLIGAICFGSFAWFAMSKIKLPLGQQTVLIEPKVLDFLNAEVFIKMNEDIISDDSFIKFIFDTAAIDDADLRNSLVALQHGAEGEIRKPFTLERGDDHKKINLNLRFPVDLSQVQIDSLVNELFKRFVNYVGNLKLQTGAAQPNDAVNISRDLSHYEALLKSFLQKKTDLQLRVIAIEKQILQISKVKPAQGDLRPLVSSSDSVYKLLTLSDRVQELLAEARMQKLIDDKTAEKIGGDYAKLVTENFKLKLEFENPILKAQETMRTSFGMPVLHTSQLKTLDLKESSKFLIVKVSNESSKAFLYKTLALSAIFGMFVGLIFNSFLRHIIKNKSRLKALLKNEN